MKPELARLLTVVLSKYIDENRKAGSMCMSNGECMAMENAFKGEKFDEIESYIQKKMNGNKEEE